MLLIVQGLKRSGNHAVINWMRRQGVVEFHNNIVPIANHFRGAPLPDPAPWSSVLARQRVLRMPRGEGALRRTERFVVAMAPLLSYCPWRVMMSLEDLPLSYTPFATMPARHSNVLIVRSARNVFASRIRKAFRISHPAYPRTCDATMQRAVEIWKQHAREALGDAKTLSNLVPIHFDRWTIDAEYRKGISAKLHLRFSDKGLGKVSSTGGGSSFDGIAFDGSPSAMNLADRASQLEGEEAALLAEVLTDPEIDELSRRLEEAFGPARP